MATTKNSQTTTQLTGAEQAQSLNKAGGDPRLNKSWGTPGKRQAEKAAASEQEARHFEPTSEYHLQGHASETKRENTSQIYGSEDADNINFNPSELMSDPTADLLVEDDILISSETISIKISGYPDEHHSQAGFYNLCEELIVDGEDVKITFATRDKSTTKFVIIAGVKVNHRIVRFIKAGHANLPTMGKVTVHPVAGKDSREACMVAMIKGSKGGINRTDTLVEKTNAIALATGVHENAITIFPQKIEDSIDMALLSNRLLIFVPNSRIMRAMAAALNRTNTKGLGYYIEIPKGQTQTEAAASDKVEANQLVMFGYRTNQFDTTADLFDRLGGASAGLMYVPWENKAGEAAGLILSMDGHRSLTMMMAKFHNKFINGNLVAVYPRTGQRLDSNRVGCSQCGERSHTQKKCPVLLEMMREGQYLLEEEAGGHGMQILEARAAVAATQAKYNNPSRGAFASSRGRTINTGPQRPQFTPAVERPVKKGMGAPSIRGRTVTTAARAMASPYGRSYSQMAREQARRAERVTKMQTIAFKFPSGEALRAAAIHAATQHPEGCSATIRYDTAKTAHTSEGWPNYIRMGVCKALGVNIHTKWEELAISLLGQLPQEFGTQAHSEFGPALEQLNQLAKAEKARAEEEHQAALARQEESRKVRQDFEQENAERERLRKALASQITAQQGLLLRVVQSITEQERNLILAQVSQHLASNLQPADTRLLVDMVQPLFNQGQLSLIEADKLLTAVHVSSRHLTINFVIFLAAIQELMLQIALNHYCRSRGEAVEEAVKQKMVGMEPHQVPSRDAPMPAKWLEPQPPQRNGTPAMSPYVRVKGSPVRGEALLNLLNKAIQLDSQGAMMPREAIVRTVEASLQQFCMSPQHMADTMLMASATPLGGPEQQELEGDNISETMEEGQLPEGMPFPNSMDSQYSHPTPANVLLQESKGGTRQLSTEVDRQRKSRKKNNKNTVLSYTIKKRREHTPRRTQPPGVDKILGKKEQDRNKQDQEGGDITKINKLCL